MPGVAHCTFVGSNLRLLIAVVAMSPNALIPSHRKPRRPSASSRALRAGVTGGFLTLAVTGATVPANAAEKPVSETQEMPTITTALATSAAKSADTAEQVAFNYERQALQDSAFSKAAKSAEKHKAEAVKKAKAEAKKKAEEARKAKEAAQARASRSSERTTLSAPSTGTGTSATLVSFLKAQLGKAYVLGATGSSAYDCSGLTQAAFKQVGIDLPRVSQDQSTAGTQVGLDNLQVGDILYWGSAGSAYHVGVYIGDGKFIGAQNPSTGIVERPLSYDMPTGAVRVL
ncbi:cell wall-associated NlpC family hydrolase [Streptomyces sp. 2333.5]|nr:cell wall-associated NlpC family hydrolase [Streptomyces sp. 2333.5]SED26780.1 Cell wall-associated hydrolase, NlpC family [Streptomyces sp. 2314.4]SEE14299.1 Cell wall-associated hydrolase, NlpC family [Streptomyces sp. 2112.2]SOE12870.1 Cell wall-associated hydrolase, NlpC family [Streptomyces sp. 2323.1]